MARKKAAKITIDAELRMAMLEKSIAAANQKLDGFARRFQTQFRGLTLPTALNQSVELLGKGFNLTGAAYGALSSLISRGQAFHELSTAFNNLYGSTTLFAKSGLEPLRQALGGLVSDLDIMRSANLAAQAGLSPERFLQIAQAARGLGAAVGKDAKTSFEELSRGVALAQEKLLKTYGVTIDNTKAEQIFAVSIHTTAEKLNEAGKAEAFRVEALKQMGEKQLAAAGATETAAEQTERFSVAWENGITQLAAAINRSQALTEALVGVTTALKSGIEYADNFGTNLGNGLDLLRVKALQLMIAWRESKIDDLQDRIEQRSFLAPDKSGLKARLAELQSELAGYNATLAETLNRHGQNIPVMSKWEGEVGECRETVLDAALGLNDLNGGMSKLPPAVKSTEDPLKKYTTWQKDAADAAKKHSKEVAEQTKKLHEDKVLKAQEDAAKRWGEAFQKETETATQNAFGFFVDIGTTTITGAAQDWSEIFSDAFKRVAIGFGAELATQIAQAAMPADFVKLFGTGGITSAQGFGQGLVRLISGGGAEGGSTSALSAALGLDSLLPTTQELGSQMFLGGAQGPLTASQSALAGLTSAASMAGIAYGGVTLGQNLLDNKKDVGGGAMSGAALGAGIGTLILPGVGTAIGALLGAAGGALAGSFGGTTDRDTLARRDFQGWFEDKIKELNTISLFNSQGELTTTRAADFTLGETRGRRFKGDWAGEMSGWSGEAQAAFGGLGEALQELSGQGDELAGQFSYMLGESLSKNVDNARLLVMQLGYSFEDLSAAVLTSAKEGDIRWAEYNRDVAGLQDAFKPGLAAVGAFAAGFQEIIDSGGRGMAAIKGVKDVAVEAGEAGMTSLDQLSASLISAGKPAEQVTAFIDALKAANVKDVAGVLSLSDEQLGAIVGNMESLSASLQQQWVSMGQQIDDLNTKLAAIPAEITSTIHIKVDGDPIPNLGGGTEETVTTGVCGRLFTESGLAKFKLGGIVNTPTMFKFGRGSLGLMGEAGPEAIMPLKRVNGRLGVNAAGMKTLSGMVINIDARGAAPGVENRILAVADALERKIGAVSRAVSARGGW